MQNKVIVITGAFGTLGRAVSHAAKEAGATVALIDHAPAPADEFTQSCIVVHGVDLTSEEDGRLAIEAVVGEAGRIDALINCAGGFAWQTLDDGDLATWERMFTLNLKTALVASKAALPHLIASGAGAIVNVAAAAARQAGAGMGAYAASKAGVMKLTESLAEELKGKVRVNAVLPSTIDTAPNRKDMPKADFSTWVTPAELAAVILFLASDRASAITGALLPVTGRV